MKKLSLILAVVLILSAFAGCGKKPVNNTSDYNIIDPLPANNTENTVPANNAENTVPPENTTDKDQAEKDQKWLDIFGSGALSETVLKEYLEGSWKMIPEGGGRDTEPFGSLVFDKNGTMTFTYDKFDDKGSVSCSYEVSRLREGYGNLEACDLLEIKVTGASDAVKARTPYVMDSSTELQILTARVQGNDIIALREIGNGESEFGLDVLMYENQSMDGMWIFVRDGESLSKTEKTDEDMRIFPGSFYALRWMDYGDSVYLQIIDIKDFEETFYEDPVRVKAVMYGTYGDALYAVKYEVFGAAPSEKNASYAPQLVYVATDPNGRVIDCDLVPYFAYGLYSQDHVEESGDGGDYRDPEKYAATDSIFLGSWTKAENPQSWVSISTDSIQTGGYRVVIYEKDKFSAAGNANIADEDSIALNQCFVEGKEEVLGYFDKTDAGIRFTVTVSGSDKLPVGTTIDYVKQN